MKKLIYVFIALVIASTAFACGTTADRAASGRNNTTPSSANSEQPATTAGDSNQAPGTPGGRAAIANKLKMAGDAQSSGPPPELQFQVAGEDSEVAVTMKPDGSVYEVRVFKSHPQLAKVEAVWNGISEKSLKFYLRNGSVVEKKTDRLNNLQTATTNVLLEIAGLQSTDPRPGDKKKRG